MDMRRNSKRMSDSRFRRLSGRKSGLTVLAGEGTEPVKALAGEAAVSDIEGFFNEKAFWHNMTGKKAKYIVRNRAHLAAPMVLFLLVYMIIFTILEHWNRLHYTVIHMKIDDMIPFCEVFVIPYLMWFGFIAVVLVWLILTDEDAYHRTCTFLAIGMSLFLVVSAIFPNIQLLRPEVMPRDNVFTHLVENLYKTDTPTNLTPSIHVFNSIGIMLGLNISKSRYFHMRPIRYSLNILGILIILSTMFIKQHSFSDVLFAFACALVCYVFIYRFDFVLITRTGRLHTMRRTNSAREVF